MLRAAKGKLNTAEYNLHPLPPPPPPSLQLAKAHTGQRKKSRGKIVENRKIGHAAAAAAAGEEAVAFGQLHRARTLFCMAKRGDLISGQNEKQTMATLRENGENLVKIAAKLLHFLTRLHCISIYIAYIFV